MICEKCSKEYDDSLTSCPHCENLKSQEKTEDLQVNIPENSAEEKNASKVKRKSRPKQKQTKSEKFAKNAVIALTCLMAVITAAVAFLGSATDIFKQGSDVKAVAVLILPQEDKEELEKHLSKLWPLANIGFDTEKMSTEELMKYIKPYCEDGLYTSFGYSSVAVTHEADPAMRFKNEEGNYCYYKIPAEEIDSILRQFNLESNHAVNNEEYYYYDSHYYFSWGESAQEKSRDRVTVTDSKRIQDGRYYVTCNFGTKELYVIASMVESDDTKYWKIHSMSLEPVFDQLGIMIKKENETAGDYEMRSLVIEGKADDGTLYRKYVLKYPYFFGETQGEIQANSFYQSIITFYQQQAQQVQSDYKKFIKKGGKTESLPIELHYTAEVSYSDEENLCLINEIAESQPIYAQEQETTSQDITTAPIEQTPVTLPKKTVECNTFDVETGLYTAKDTLIGKDYQTVSEILYRIYYGYAYDSLLNEGVISEAVPEDAEDIGEKIYNSASTLCQDGYVFCYVNDSGYREDVVIPFKDLEKLTAITEQ